MDENHIINKTNWIQNPSAYEA